MREHLNPAPLQLRWKATAVTGKHSYIILNYFIANIGGPAHPAGPLWDLLRQGHFLGWKIVVFEHCALPDLKHLTPTIGKEPIRENRCVRNLRNRSAAI